MALKPVSGHLLEIGDKVKMNIPVLAKGDLDGVDITTTGKNYWKYINEHPDEVYTVTGFNFDYEDCPYILSGYLADNTWAADELIHIPEAKDNFEVIKNMTIEEAPEILTKMILELCEDGMPSQNCIAEWLSAKPQQDGDCK